MYVKEYINAMFRGSWFKTEPNSLHLTFDKQEDT